MCYLYVCFLDINECDDETDDCEQICTNTEGSFDCSCMSGFTLDDNGKNCTGESFTKVIDFSYLHNFIYEGSTNVCFSDINECEDDTDDCEQICTNTEGSFDCSCMSGFTLDDNGKNCTGESFTKVINFSYLHNFIYEGCTNDYC